VPIAYCRECGWSRQIDDDESNGELNRAMIDHYVETGHSIEQCAIVDESVAEFEFDP
jgi:hypothetical protein